MHDERPGAAAQRPASRGLLPVMEGVAFDGLLAPGHRRATGGSAWYDAFAIGEGRVVVAAGDCTRRASAAVLQRILRETFGAVRPEHKGSGRLRDAAARLQRRTEDAPATLFLGVVDLDARTLTYVTAGRTGPFLRYADGTVVDLPIDGPPEDLASADHPVAEIVVDLRGAQLLLLSTGGLLRSFDGIEGTAERLRHALEDGRLPHRDRAAAWIAEHVRAGASHEDIALLTLRFPPAVAGGRIGSPAWTVSWSFEATAASSHAARRAFAGFLRTKPGHGIDDLAAELIFGELLGNVVRHAPGRVEIRLDWTDDLPVLHIIDNGPGYRTRHSRERLPLDELSESGRGLFIISACAAQFSVRNRRTRGAHATVTLPKRAL